jgi:TatA/E family protein of Tat protein translocase
MMTPILAFGMPAAPEWIFIGILALVLFGPKKLPELARGLGKALAELQKAKEDFHREITGVPPLPKIQQPDGVQGVTPPVRVEAPEASVSEVVTTAPSNPSEEKQG